MLIQRGENSRFYSSLGILTNSDKTIPFGSQLKILDKQYSAPELQPIFNSNDEVLLSSLSAEKADVYSLGLSLLMIIGEFSFAASNKALKTIQESPPKIFEYLGCISEKITPKLKFILEKMLDCDPDSRASASYVVDALQSEFSSFSSTIDFEFKMFRTVNLGTPPTPETDIYKQSRLDLATPLFFMKATRHWDIFLVKGEFNKYILFRRNYINEEEADQLEKLAIIAQHLQSIIPEMTSFVAFAINKSKQIVEWMENYSGVSIEDFQNQKSRRSKTLGHSNKLSYIKQFLLCIAKILKVVENQIFLNKISRTSILFDDSNINSNPDDYQIRYEGFWHSIIIHEKDGIIRKGTRIVGYIDNLSAPEVILSTNEMTEVVQKDFRSTPADIYSIGLVILILLYDLNFFDIISLVPERCVSSENLFKLISQDIVPACLKPILKGCLMFDPSERISPSSLEEMLKYMEDFSTVPEEEKSPHLSEEMKTKIQTAELKEKLSKTEILKDFTKLELENKIMEPNGNCYVLKATTHRGLNHNLVLKIYENVKEEMKDIENYYRCLKLTKYSINILKYSSSLPFFRFEVLTENCDCSLMNLKLTLKERRMPFDLFWNLFKKFVIALSILHKMNLAHGNITLNSLYYNKTTFFIGNFDFKTKNSKIQTPTIYTPPEFLAVSKSFTPSLAQLQKADVYSLGVCFLELINKWSPEYIKAITSSSTGRHFSPKKEIEKIKYDINESKDLFTDLLRKMLKKKPEERYDIIKIKDLSQ